MANLLATLEQVKRAGGLHTSDTDTRILRLIESSSRSIDRLTRRRFIPETATNLYRWPSRNSRGPVLWLDQDLLAVTTLQSKAQDASPTTIAAADYFLEPHSLGPPYTRIEIDLSSTSVFESGDTPQRSVSIAGRWGYSEDTIAAGTVASGLASDATVTAMVCSNGSLLDVGDTLLIESEQVYVSGRSYAALGSVLINDASVTASMSDVTITLDPSHGVLAGEVIRLDSEELYIVGISTNDATVIRGYNGSVLASHANDTPVHTNRTLVIVRGVNGTTGAVHADATAVVKYQPPLDINQLCIAETLAALRQEESSYGRTIGSGEGATEFNGRDLAGLRKTIKEQYQRVRSAAI